MPGVVTVVTGADLLEAVAPLPTNWVLPGMPVPVHRVLADEVVRFQGEGVAAVVAADAYTAADAADAIDVDYEPLPAVTDPWQAAQPNAPLVHPGLTDSEDGNIVFRVPMYAGDYAAAQQHADVVIRRRLRNQNLIPGALEPRSVLAEYDDGAGTVTVHSSTQSPHIIKRMLAEVLSFPEERLRVVAPDVGGGFGSKLHLYPEEVLVTALAIRLRRAVKWTATRSEDFQATNHGRDHVQDVELCATADGVITGIKATLFANLGAYLSDMAAGIPTANCATMVTGVYRIPNVHVDTLGVLTHTSRVDTYRGAGRPEATYLIERMVDQLARELSIDPADIRRRNFIPPDAFPYQSPLFVYDSGNYEHNLDTALGIVGYEKLRKEQAELRLNGRYKGIGLATYTEFTGLGSGRLTAAVGFAYGGWEYARVLVHPTGRVSVHVGTADHGQGHATSYAQIAADTLGLRPDDIDVVEGDTARVEFGQGTFNSRSLPVGGSAVHDCCQKVLAKARRIAAHMLKTAVEDVRYEAAVFSSSQEGATAALVCHGKPSRGWRTSSPISRPASNPGSMSGSSMSPRNSRSRSAPTSPWSRSTPRPATSPLTGSSRSTTAGRCSTRCWRVDRYTAASPKGSARRCSRAPATTTTVRWSPTTGRLTPFRAPSTFRESKPRTPSPRHRSPRSGSRESVRQEPSGPRRPSSTPCWTRWPRSE